MSNQTDIDGLRSQLALALHRHWKLFLIQGIVMMVLGFLAVAEPNVASGFSSLQVFSALPRRGIRGRCRVLPGRC
jgi:uncharacterized membrane protein HdeD (DUF308 family)